MAKFRRFTQDDLVQIEIMLNEDPEIFVQDLAERVGKTSAAIIKLLERNGGRENFTAEKEHLRALQAKQDRKTGIRKRLTQGEARESIEVVLMHIDIFYEELKALKEKIDGRNI